MKINRGCGCHNLYALRHPLMESKADEQRLIDFAGEDLARRFLKLRHLLKSPENDLYYWIKKKSVEDLQKRVIDLETTPSKTKQKQQEKETGAELLLETEHWKVYRITTFAASQRYGRDTQWCITGSHGSGDKYWNQYTNNDVDFYFIIANGNYDNRGDDSKFAMAVHEPSSTYTVYNQQDSEVYFEDIPYYGELYDPEIDLTGDLDYGLAIETFCSECGVGLQEGQWYYAPDSGFDYCRECYYELYFDCRSCYEGTPIEDVIETADGEKICPYCMEHYYGTCDECGEVYDNEHLENIEGRLICPECKEN